MGIQVSAKTDIGRLRQNNEDYFFASESSVGIFEALYILADGMGGHSNGEIASQTAVATVLSYLREAPLDLPERLLFQANALANLEVRKQGERMHCMDMGTTLVICGVINGTAYVSNIGDSRLYLLDERKNRIRQITKDHSYAEELAERGMIDRGSREYEENKNKITRAIGIYSEPDPDFFTVSLQGGEYILLCSDGLSRMVRDVVIKNLALDTNFTLEERVDSLIREANRLGGKDNITVILAQYPEE